jgi:MoxR-like ATPase
MMCFDRSGRRLVVIDPASVSVVDVETGDARQLPFADTRATAAFDDQLWIVGHDDKLIRVDYDGNQLGDTVQLSFSARAHLHVAPCGAAAAIWGALPHVALREEAGAIMRVEIPGDPDAVIPLTGRKWLIAKRALLTLPTGLVVPLPSNTTVLDGAVMTDGKCCALLITHAGGRQLIVVALGTGQIVYRRAVPKGSVRIAAARGTAVMHADTSTLSAIDLRTGQELFNVRLDHDVIDFAIDPDGRRLVTHSAQRAIEIHDVAELTAGCAFARAQPAAAPVLAEPAGDDAAPAHQPVATDERTRLGLLPVSAPAHDVRSSLAVPVLHALDPRQPIPPADRERTRRDLELELRRVELWAVAAIADAWNTRRLGYGNEGKHPFELEVAAIVGMSSGYATDYVVAAQDLIAQHDRVIATDPGWRSRETVLGALRLEAMLDELELDIMMVVAAAALRGEIARLYGILSNDSHRAIVDELLVQQVLAARHDRRDVALALDPRASLVRLGIVRYTTSKRARPFAELTLEPVILDRLRGVLPDLGSATSVRSATCELDDIDMPREVLDAALAALERATPEPVRLVVRGRIGSGRRTLLAALAAAAGRQLAVIDCTALPRRAELFVTELARSLRQAQLTGCVPCVAHLDEVTFDEHAARAVASETLRVHPGPIAIVAAPDTPSPCPAGHLQIALPLLAEGERRAVWDKAMRAAGVPAVEVDRLAARYKIGPGVIRRAVAAATRAPDPVAACEAYIRQTRDARLAQYARRVDRLASWSSVVLPPDILDSLRELIARVRHGHTVFEAWGMNKTMATSRGLTALFQGQPGTGKTLVAGVIARELGLDLYQVDLSKVMSKWIGETERNLSTIFDAAEDGQVVLLFDEADSLFAKRTEVRSSNDRYANLEVNYLLQRLDSFEGIAILTTNSGGSIDQAFKRRLSFRLSFPFPDEETREQLWRAHLPAELPIAGELSLGALARKYQLSGGYIRNACLRAAFLAAQDETALHQRHLERAVALELTELGKLSSGGAIA